VASRQEQITVVLDNLRTDMGADISGVAAVGMDGIVLVSRMAADVNADRVGAVAATMMGVTRRVANELKIGLIEETVLRANGGQFVVLPAGDQHLLAISIRQGANLGMVLLEARRAAQEIGKMI